MMIDTEILQDIYTDHDLCGVQKRELLKVIAMIKQERLIELPCAVGDTVYFVGEYGIGGVKEYEVGCIVLKGNADYSRRLWEDVYGGDLGSFEDIGETVFLTKEEAEAKLVELKGE